MKFKESWVFKVILAGIGLVIAVILGTVGFAIFWMWYWNTAFKEINFQSFKPQERPGAKAIPIECVMQERAEPRLASRQDAQSLENPVVPTAGSLSKGKQFYENICSPCHGIQGQGVGVMGTVPNLAPISDEEANSLRNYLGEFSNLPPPDLYLDYVTSLSDGDIFYTITYGGYAIMPSFKDSLSPEQRWHLINYLREGLGQNDLGE